MRTGIPGPGARLLRNRAMVASAAVMACIAVTASGLAQASDLRISSTISSNWRGAYDILVTARTDGVGKEAAATSGLVEPDFIAYQGGGGISLAQLARIRLTSGVSIAAPIGFVGYLDSDAVHPDIFVPKASLPMHPALYRFTVQLNSSDGVHTLPVTTLRQDVLLGPANLNAQQLPIVTADNDYSWDNTGIDITFAGSFPPIVNSVEAVDPTAEQRLLGPGADFLSRLRVPAAELTAATFDVTRIPTKFPWARLALQRLQPHPGQPVAQIAGPSENTPVVPLAVSAGLAYALSATLTVEQIGPSLSRYPPTPKNSQLDLSTLERGNGQNRRRIGTSIDNLSKTTSPLVAHEVTLVWPGGKAPTGHALDTTSADHLTTRLAGRANYEVVHSGGRLAYRIQPQGPVRFDGSAATGGTTSLPSVSSGVTQSYRRYTPFKLAARPKSGTVNAPGPSAAYVLAPVASFRPASISLPNNPVNHVPLGAYEHSTAQLLDGQLRSTGKVLGASPNPLGFVTGPPDVITTIQAAQLLRGSKRVCLANGVSGGFHQ